MLESLYKAAIEGYRSGIESWKSSRAAYTARKTHLKAISQKAHETALKKRLAEKHKLEAKKAADRGKYRALPIREKIAYHADKVAVNIGHTARALHDRGVRPVAIAGELNRAGRALVHGYTDDKKKVKARAVKPRKAKRKVTVKAQKTPKITLVQGIPKYRMFNGVKYRLRNIIDDSEEFRAIALRKVLTANRYPSKIVEDENDIGEPMLALYVGPKSKTPITL